MVYPSSSGGFMTEKLEDKIKKDIFTAKWTDLYRHYAVGSVYLIDGSVDLVELSVAIAEDNSDKIKDLLETGKMGKIPSELAETFDKENGMFQCSILQPFVFVQHLDEKNNDD